VPEAAAEQQQQQAGSSGGSSSSTGSSGSSGSSSGSSSAVPDSNKDTSNAYHGGGGPGLSLVQPATTPARPPLQAHKPKLSHPPADERDEVVAIDGGGSGSNGSGSGGSSGGVEDDAEMKRALAEGPAALALQTIGTPDAAVSHTDEATVNAAGQNEKGQRRKVAALQTSHSPAEEYEEMVVIGAGSGSGSGCGASSNGGGSGGGGSGGGSGRQTPPMPDDEGSDVDSSDVDAG
jgi:hypothetical protein